MKKSTRLSILCLALTLGAAAGCAKKEVVKKEEPLTPAAATTNSVTNKPVTAETASNRPNTEKTERDTLLPITDASELKAALQEIYFDFDSSAISEQSKNTLTKNTRILMDEPSVSVKIEGHCDERGSAEYNLALGERRAQAAMKYLVTMGIPANRLSVISFGKEKPVAPGHDETSWAKNRRDAFTLNGN